MYGRLLALGLSVSKPKQISQPGRKPSCGGPRGGGDDYRGSAVLEVLNLLVLAGVAGLCLRGMVCRFCVNIAPGRKLFKKPSGDKSKAVF